MPCPPVNRCDYDPHATTTMMAALSDEELGLVPEPSPPLPPPSRSVFAGGPLTPLQQTRSAHPSHRGSAVVIAAYVIAVAGVVVIAAGARGWPGALTAIAALAGLHALCTALLVPALLWGGLDADEDA
jgi:hypothetical protein